MDSALPFNVSIRNENNFAKKMCIYHRKIHSKTSSVWTPDANSIPREFLHPWKSTRIEFYIETDLNYNLVIEIW